MTELVWRPLLDCCWCGAELPDGWHNRTRWRMVERGGCPECSEVVARLKARHKAAQAARAA